MSVQQWTRASNLTLAMGAIISLLFVWFRFESDVSISQSKRLKGREQVNVLENLHTLEARYIQTAWMWNLGMLDTTISNSERVGLCIKAYEMTEENAKKALGYRETKKRLEAMRANIRVR